MATRKGKDKPSNPSDFGAALESWEESNPDAWPPPESRKPRRKGVNEDSALAQQLRERFGAPETKSRPSRTAAPSSPQRETQPAASSASNTASAKRQVTAEELMQEAFEALDDAHDPTAKYTGRGYDKALDVEVIDETAAGVVDEAIERYDSIDGHTQEDVAFLQLMSDADVVPLDRSLDKLRTSLDARVKWSPEATPQYRSGSPVSAEALEAPVLTGSQRDLLRRARKQSFVPTLNLRHQRRAEAVQELAAFVLKKQHQGVRFVRVVTGKGKQSEDLPVLKPMVLEWCEMEPGSQWVRAYAPETDRSGNFGVVVLELRR